MGYGRMFYYLRLSYLEATKVSFLSTWYPPCLNAVWEQDVTSKTNRKPTF